MKGFTPRERNGLIGLATVVALCLAAGPLARLAGCNRHPLSPAETPPHLLDSTLADSIKAAAYPAAPKNSTPGDSTPDSTAKKKKSKSDHPKKSGQKKSQKSPTPQSQRNLLNEEVQTH